MPGNAAIFAPLSFDLLSTFGATAQQLTKEKKPAESTSFSAPAAQIQGIRGKEPVHASLGVAQDAGDEDHLASSHRPS